MVCQILGRAEQQTDRSVRGVGFALHLNWGTVVVAWGRLELPTLRGLRSKRAGRSGGVDFVLHLSWETVVVAWGRLELPTYRL